METVSNVRAMQAAADTQGMRLIGHNDLNGYGDAMQVIKRGDYVYVAHVGLSPLRLTILDASDPTNPRVVRQFEHAPNTHNHKVQIVGNVMIQNSEEPYFGKPTDQPRPITGLNVYTLDDPTDPKEVAFYPVPGTGVHRIWFEEAPYAHIAGCLPGVRGRSYHIVDLSEPAQPTMAGCWWIPGTKDGDPEPWEVQSEGSMSNMAGHTIMTIGVHGAIPCGDRSFVSCLDAGFALLDISDLGAPKVLGRVNWYPPYGGFLHTSLPLPGRGLAICACETLRPTLEADGDKRIWVVDVRNERQPVVISSFPRPKPPAGSPWETYWDRPGSFGPHNLHENRPGSFQSESLIFSTWNNAGLRLHDVSDADRPTEIAHFNPEPPPGQDAPKANDLYVDADGLIYLTDRLKGGLYVLECTERLR